MKLNYKVVSELLGISKTTYYEWKKKEKPIIRLIESYFSQNEIEKYIEKQSLVKLDVINSFDRKKEIKNIMKIIKLHATTEIEKGIIELIPRFIAAIVKNKNLNSFNTINIEKQFEMFNTEYPNKYNFKLMNLLKNLGFMQADTIVAIIDFSEYDFIEMFDNVRITKKIKDDDVINFFIPFLHYKYNDINSKIDESIIMNKFDDYFKDNSFLNGIEAIVKREEEKFTEEIQRLSHRKNKGI